MSQKMNLTFLGTGSSTPTSKRNHVGILVSFGSENILFDCGEGIQRQFKIAKISPCKLTKIFISHWHGDHTLGIPGLLETLSMEEYSKKLEIYGPKGTKNNIRNFEKIYGEFKLNFTIKEIKSGTVVDNKDYTIQSLPMTHGIPSNAYSLTIKNKIRLHKNKIQKLKIPNSPLLAKLQQGKDVIHPITKKKISAKTLAYLEKGKKISIIMDTSFNKNTYNVAKNSDILVCEATFASDNQKKAHEYKHLTSSQAATIAKKSKSKKLYLIHLSHRYQKDNSKLLKEAKEIFLKSKIAEDFQHIEI